MWKGTIETSQDKNSAPGSGSLSPRLGAAGVGPLSKTDIKPDEDNKWEGPFSKEGKGMGYGATSACSVSISSHPSLPPSSTTNLPGQGTTESSELLQSNSNNPIHHANSNMKTNGKLIFMMTTLSLCQQLPCHSSRRTSNPLSFILIAIYLLDTCHPVTMNYFILLS